MTTIIVVREVPDTVNISVPADEPIVLGPIGAAGPQGPAGPAGASGATGPAGPPGSDGVTTSTFISAIALGGQRIVTFDSNGQLIYADTNIAGHMGRAAGITTGATNAGVEIQIQTKGEVIEPSWTWTAGQPVYLGLNGLLTQVVPTAVAFLQIVGYASATTKLFLDFQVPIKLA